MNDSSYKLKVNGKLEFDIDEASVDAQDVIAIDNNSYHSIEGGQSVKSRILSCDIRNKVLEVEVGGVAYQVSIEDSFDQLVKKMGLSTNVVKKLSDVKAPMPGLVLDIMVNEGDYLQAGDSIMILEAMKMENVIKASADIIIKEILIKKGDAVEKNQILINLED